MLVTFDSLEQYVKVCSQVEVQEANNSWNSPSSWYGNISYTDACTKAINGDISLVEPALTLMESIEHCDLSSSQSEIVKHYCVGRVNLTDWIEGTPTPFRRRVRTKRQSNPIRVIVSMTSSAGIDSDTMLKRGAAILALVMQLQKARAIDLVCMVETHGVTDGSLYQLIPIESRPLNLSQAAFVLSNVGFPRHLGYSYATFKDGFDGSWPRGRRGEKASPEYLAELPERIGLKPEDLFIDSAGILDELITDPIAWINSQLERYKEL